MKARLPMIWLAILTIVQSFVITDMSSTLKSVEDNQASTLKYMKKSATILHKIKKGKLNIIDESTTMQELPSPRS